VDEMKGEQREGLELSPLIVASVPEGWCGSVDVGGIGMRCGGSIGMGVYNWQARLGAFGKRVLPKLGRVVSCLVPRQRWDVLLSGGVVPGVGHSAGWVAGSEGVVSVA
jgi:hypothetical protein